MDNLTVAPEDWASVIVAPPPQTYTENPYEEWAITFTCDPKKPKFEEWKHNSKYLCDEFCKENFLEHTTYVELHKNGHPHVHGLVKIHPVDIPRIKREIKKFGFFYGWVEFRKCWNVDGWLKYIQKNQINHE